MNKGFLPTVGWSIVTVGFSVIFNFTWPVTLTLYLTGAVYGHIMAARGLGKGW